MLVMELFEGRGVSLRPTWASPMVSTSDSVTTGVRTGLCFAVPLLGGGAACCAVYQVFIIYI